MASSKFNVLTHGLSGLVVDMLVFRQKAGRTIVASRPRPTSRAVQAIALAIRDRFRRVASYAASVMSNLVLKGEYQLTAKPGQSAYNMAFTDYQKAPEIYEDVNLAVYTGTVGEAIEVSVMDDFRVESVSVQIKTAADILIEEGAAVQSPNGLDWIYTTTAENTDLPGSKIIFKAKDLPGNETVLEKIIV